MTAAVDILVGIDDTDNLDSRGTGELAAELAAAIDDNGWGRSGFVSRHQLLVHPEIPYTSHNSAMCFSARLVEGMLTDFIAYAGRFLESASAAGSDPGLCVFERGSDCSGEQLVEFGRVAKREVLTKAEALSLAAELGVHLSEHGGSGDGVIGALAGVGLRLGGCDGRLRGELHFAEGLEVLSVADLCGHPFVDRVEGLGGQPVGPLERVRLGIAVKTVLREGESVLLVTPLAGDKDKAGWQTCHRRLLKVF